MVKNSSFFEFSVTRYSWRKIVWHQNPLLHVQRDGFCDIKTHFSTPNRRFLINYEIQTGFLFSFTYPEKRCFVTPFTMSKDEKILGLNPPSHTCPCSSRFLSHTRQKSTLGPALANSSWHFFRQKLKKKMKPSLEAEQNNLHSRARSPKIQKRPR